MFNSKFISSKKGIRVRLAKLSVFVSSLILGFSLNCAFAQNVNQKDVQNANNNQNNNKQAIKNIKVIQIVEHPALDQTRKGIYDELMESSIGKNNKINWVYESAQGNMSLAQQIANKFVSEKPDAIVAIPTSVSQILVKLTKKNKIPVIFSSVTDPISSNLVADLNKPGANITGVSNYVEVKPQLKMFREAMPNLKKLGFIYNAGEVNSIKLLKETQKAARDLNIEIVEATASKTSEVSAAANSIIGKVDAIFITNDNTALAAFRTIVKCATKAKKPVFVSDVDIVCQGALLSLGPNQYQVGRATGKMLLKVLNGKNPANIPVGFPVDVELYINKDAANKINFEFSKEIIKKADKIISSK